MTVFLAGLIIGFVLGVMMTIHKFRREVEDSKLRWWQRFKD